MILACRKECESGIMSNCGLLYIIICNEVNNLKRNGSLLSEFSQSMVNDKLSSSDNYTN